MTDDQESHRVLVVVTNKVTGALVCSRPAISKLLSVCVYGALSVLCVSVWQSMKYTGVFV